MTRWKWLAGVGLVAALVASIAVGLLGFWPDLRGESTSDRREKVRIATAFTDVNSAFLPSRIQLGYLPHWALVEAHVLGHGQSICYLVAKDFGYRIDDADIKFTSCDVA